jgi:hypothetical protein
VVEREGGEGRNHMAVVVAVKLGCWGCWEGGGRRPLSDTEAVRAVGGGGRRRQVGKAGGGGWSVKEEEGS